ncbi:hypothetical protein SAMN04487859_14112 [Roseovarius lutimaris]|uniref:Uncharacterized protein n=1 Tax=Roseovarius lutimaris TaxID=1005928 RepID=A0A1I5GW02_9RHOB|nr:hypothetical protein [Roseovarius lutimaris]SFO40182.1 hypothetical protein SAMN04487859_14112 [Roseovarius lutimaris]
MKHLTLATALCLMSAPAFAFHCPMDMGEIDAALAEGTTLSEAQLSEVQSLRAEGETLHNSGDHQGAVDTLAKAKAILGIN